MRWVQKAGANYEEMMNQQDRRNMRAENVYGR